MIYTEFVLICDRARCTARIAGSSKAAVTAHAREDGWQLPATWERRPDTQDLCPEHRPDQPMNASILRSDARHHRAGAV